MSLRFYLLAEEERLRRIPSRVLNKAEPIPRYANQRLKVIQTLYHRDARGLLLEISGSFCTFDENGYAHVSEDDLRGASLRLHAASAIEEERAKSPRVFSLDLRRQEKQLKNKHVWQPSDADHVAIHADLLGSARPPGTRAIPILKLRDDTPV